MKDFWISSIVPVLPKVRRAVSFGAEEDIYIRKNLLDAGSCLLAGPEIGTVVDIKRDQGSYL